MLHTSCAAAVLALCMTVLVSAQIKEAPADQQAYRAALVIRDPAQRLVALGRFYVQYPEGQ